MLVLTVNDAIGVEEPTDPVQRIEGYAIWERLSIKLSGYPPASNRFHKKHLFLAGDFLRHSAA
jgi:hypothetical protein